MASTEIDRPQPYEGLCLSWAASTMPADIHTCQHHPAQLKLPLLRLLPCLSAIGSLYPWKASSQSAIRMSPAGLNGQHWEGNIDIQLLYQGWKLKDAQPSWLSLEMHALAHLYIAC